MTTPPHVLAKYSIGVGDRFAHQAKAQLQACLEAARSGVTVIPVWNKSNREHLIIGSDPQSTRAAADAAVHALAWQHPYYCDADHINLTTVDRFLAPCDFFTIDVADAIGKPADAASLDQFVRNRADLAGTVRLDGETIEITPALLRATAEKFLAAVEQAGQVYRRIEAAKGKGNFIAEISMDETDAAQTPAELLIILAAIADEGIPIQTIAPKFTGRFNKGVDYVGDVAGFRREIQLDVAAIAWAVRNFGLPKNLKLSIHSGSDKFSIYPAIHEATRESGVHLKTAGTTWLEELIGLAESGGEGLALAKEIYAQACDHRAELCAPYATVIDISPAQLPQPAAVAGWSSEQYTSALRHDPHSSAYNPSLRQLLHVGFKVAAKMGNRYLNLLDANQAVIARNVTQNLFDRHIAPVFLGKPSPIAAEAHAEVR
ncbi:MAG TPA: tagaturonate epimerase family protein [Acidobacteriaceae bacterium]